ncbi:MAG: malonate decarboxylase holo-[acyl-carrier-protein] synthase [Rhodospirillaceae bacterium]|nr:malonate decarboxylase holo-[acyl-carrier-protein] synthase [Rhodospirillaceae bacterium]
MHLTRHLLADLSVPALARLPDAVVAGLLPPFRSLDVSSRVSACLSQNAVPGIVCRPTQVVRANQVQLGLSFPFREKGTRVRAAIVVDRSDIVSLTDPYRVAERSDDVSGALGGVLRAVVVRGAAYGVEVGVIGSVAMEIETGLPYATTASDIDLVVRGGDIGSYRRFAEDLAEIARVLEVRVDVEVELTDGSGVKLTELLSASRTLLAKDLSEVRMIGREEALAALS